MQKNVNDIPYKAFLHWLLLAGMITFSFFLLYDLGVLPRIIDTDSTRITLVIFMLFTFASVHCGYRSWFISRQNLSLFALRESIKHSALHDEPTNTMHQGEVETSSLALNYFALCKSSDTEQDTAQLGELLAEAARGSHKIGWFIVGVLLKLGLLGTVIGFVLMLGTVSNLDSLDISGVKQLMQQMTQGMGIAMFTTMAGLLSSILLGLQYLLLDRSADKFVAETVRIRHENLDVNNGLI